MVEFCSELPSVIGRRFSLLEPSSATHNGLQPLDQTARDGFIGQGESLEVLDKFVARPWTLGLEGA